MIWNMNQTKKAYQCKNVKTRTTINWSSCANDGISKDKHFSRLQGHNLLDNNVNLKLKFSCCLGQDLQVHATAPLYLHVYCKNPNIQPNPKHYPKKLFKTSQSVRCRWGAAVLSAATFLKPQPPPYEPYSPNYPQNYGRRHECRWEFSVPIGSKIVIKFHSIEVFMFFNEV